MIELKFDKNTKISGMNNHDLFRYFIYEIQKFYSDGIIPTSASQDLKYIINLRNNRLKKLGLKQEYNIEYVKDSYITSLGGISIFDKSIDNSQRFKYAAPFKEIKKYYYNNAIIYNNKSSLYFYETIISANTNKDISGTLYNCPNCGASAKINELEIGGCPYCHTKFMTSDLFPRITNYYVLYTNDLSIDTEEMKKRVRKSSIIGASILVLIAVLFNVQAILSHDMEKMLNMIILIPMCAVVGGYGASFLVALKKMFSMGMAAAQNVPLAIESVNSKSVIDSSLQQFDSQYNYAYFESKVLSYLKIILFSDNTSNLCMYCGQNIDSQFSNLIDMNYRQVMTIENFNNIDNNLFINMKVYLDNEYLNNNRVVCKKEELLVTIKHNINFKANMDFVISAVTCKSCGGSFDASYQKNCSHCGSEYHISDEDWQVTNIQKLK